MPRNGSIEVQNNFSKGLVTDVTGVNSPDNSVISSDNVIYDKTGKVYRRKGFKLEAGYTFVDQSTLSLDDGITNEFLWNTISETGSTEFLVVQFAETVIFYQTLLSGTISDSRKSFSINLLDFKVTGTTSAEVRKNEVSFAEGFGKLFITHPDCDPILVEYDSVGDSISSQTINLQIRDFEGVDDGQELTERKSTLTDLHEYNLLNQGWYGEARDSDDSMRGKLNWYDGKRPEFPSNADVWFLFKDSNEEMNPGVIDTVDVGNTAASKGHYILDLFDQDRTNVSGVAGLTAVVTNKRPSKVAFFAGRVFYTGVASDSIAHKIYFSQIIEGDTQYGRCYQKSDPTSEDYFDLLDSDGGVITIPEINTIIDVKVSGGFLLLFASNGIWSISGATDGGDFKATDYFINKISTVPSISSGSIVETDGPIFWWNYDGIYSLVSGESGALSVKEVSQGSIQNFYDKIDNKGIDTTKGWYNTITKEIMWLYHSPTDISVNDADLGIYSYGKALTYNLYTQGFYPFSMSNVNPTIAPVIVGVVSVASNQDLANTQTFKFLTKGPFGTGQNQALSFSGMTDETYVDWGNFGGISYTSTFDTGYMVKGEMLKRFQNNYLSVYTEYEYDSSCLVQGIWNYSNSTSSGKETIKQQVYRRKDGYDYLRSKLKIKGVGFSLQFRFTSEENKPFNLIGWSTLVSEGSIP